ncbi:MAG: SpoIIE family protein phosphatase [Candidatus Omnitrophica bacterium]|nr:SpoIIE family protein phosphatase [Candidatus Omnitrophota bacterium]
MQNRDLDRINKLLQGASGAGGDIASREALTHKRHLDSLLSVIQAIGSIFVLDELLDKIVEYGLRVTGAERGFLLLYDEKDQQLRLKLSRGLEKEFASLPFSYDNYKLGLGFIKEVERTKEALIVDPLSFSDSKISAELKNFQVKQAVAVPLKTKTKDLGIVYMDNRLAGGTFGKDELELMKSFAVQASVSIENAFLVANLMEQERLKQEMELGRTIQMNLLPRRSPQVAGFNVVGLMAPAKEIGGDYYDYMPTLHEHDGNKEQHVGIVIGDVSGKGVAAGLIMATAKATLKGLSQQDLTPKQILSQANTVLFEYTSGQKFMTMLYFRFKEKERVLNYSSAGHEHILVYHSDNRKVDSIMGGGFMLGMMPDINNFLEDHEVVFNSGDKIVLYTDGVTEARNTAEELFGLPRLIEVISKHGNKPAQELLDSVKEEVYSFIGTREQYDDITLVVMEAT